MHSIFEYRDARSAHSTHSHLHRGRCAPTALGPHEILTVSAVVLVIVKCTFPCIHAVSVSLYQPNSIANITSQKYPPDINLSMCIFSGIGPVLRMQRIDENAYLTERRAAYTQTTSILFRYRSKKRCILIIYPFFRSQMRNGARSNSSFRKCISVRFNLQLLTLSYVLYGKLYGNGE